MKIMLIYRPNAEGQVALAAARTEARLRGAKILAVRHVRGAVEQAIPAIPARGGTTRDANSQVDLSKLRAEMEALENDLQADGIAAEAVLLTDGSDAPEAFLDLAQTEAVDLIVMGIRRRSPVGKFLMGSLAQAMLLRADCPVLAVKAPA